MTKEEIIEAINSTIVTNGQKGITAESLANLLIEMASATPEGGGSGGSFFYIGLPNEDFTQFDLTEEEQSHNAAMYNAFVNSNVFPVSIDMTRYYISMGVLPENITSDDVKMHTKIDGEIQYISENAASILGAPFFGISVVEMDVIILSDGSIKTMKTE
jgi:hypothetical protein